MGKGAWHKGLRQPDKDLTEYTHCLTRIVTPEE